MPFALARDRLPLFVVLIAAARDHLVAGAGRAISLPPLNEIDLHVVKGEEDEDSNGHCVWRNWYLPIYQPLYVFCLIKNSTGGQRTLGCSG